MNAVRSVHALRFVITRGLGGMRQTLRAQVLAISSIAASCLILAAIALAWVNAHSVARTWGADIPITAYLSDGIGPQQIERLRLSLAQVDGVHRVEFVDRGAAHERLKAALGTDSDVVDDLDPRLLPNTLEIHVEALSAAELAALAEGLEALAPIDDVDTPGSWAAEVSEALDHLRHISLLVMAFVGLALVATSWGASQLTVYARRTEIEIMSLVGATGRFLRGPMIVQGIVQACLGCAISIGLLWGIFVTVRPLLERILSLFLAGNQLRFLDACELSWGAAAVILMCAVGSRSAALFHERSR